MLRVADAKGTEAEAEAEAVDSDRLPLSPSVLLWLVEPPDPSEAAAEFGAWFTGLRVREPKRTGTDSAEGVL